MKTERITIRIDEDLKNEINILAEKNEMNTSEFVNKAIQEKINDDKLSDSQERFLQLFDTAFKKSYDPFFKQMMVTLNRCEFNTRLSIKQQDIFMGNLKVPQTRDDLSISVIDHPITEVAREKVLKDIRTMKAKKKLEDDQE